MIPKTIHYVWLGNKPKTKRIEKCIDSWKRFCPDYKIMEWNEKSFDINSHHFIKEAYDVGNYAFASDVMRLMILYQYGGIYVDADVELIRNIDDLLYNKAFVGFETDYLVNSGQILGTIKENEIIKQHLEQYDKLHYKDCADITKVSCPRLLTGLLVQKGLRLDGSEQVIEDLHIYPMDFFNPFETRTGRMKITINTYSIHWSAYSWGTRNPLRRNFTRFCHRLFGINCFVWIKKIMQYLEYRFL